jgi:thymidylate synthase
MNNVDRQYLDLMQDILTNGNKKETRAGTVLSVFGRTMRFDLSEGIPLLTTKKVYTRGVIIELLWFLKGDTNIKYLVENKVNIWNDDAYRFYKETVNKEFIEHEHVNKMNIVSKEEFISNVLSEKTIEYRESENGITKNYKFGDLGPVYGEQWRNFNSDNIDQISDCIDKLKNNPDDRRILCIAFNPAMIKEMALPPCHVMFQFYTSKMSFEERYLYYCKENSNYEDISKGKSVEYIEKELDDIKVPVRKLSCMWTQRSCDVCAGIPFNMASYAFLTYMMCEVCNMAPGELIASMGDTHIYMNHVKNAEEQIQRKGNETLAVLRFARNITDIDDFKFEDFIIDGYKPDSPIKYQLNVG